MRGSRAAWLPALVVALGLAAAAPAAASGLTPSPAKPPESVVAPGAPVGIYLRTAAGFVPLTKGKVRVTTEGGVKRYFVPLGAGALPEAAPPIQARDALPATENYWLLKLREDGQIFSWNIAESYFEESIEFGARFDSQSDDKVLTWNALEPGVWAFVESALTSIAEICYPFRVLPAPGAAPAPRP